MFGISPSSTLFRKRGLLQKYKQLLPDNDFNTIQIPTNVRYLLLAILITNTRGFCSAACTGCAAATYVQWLQKWETWRSTIAIVLINISTYYLLMNLSFIVHTKYSSRLVFTLPTSSFLSNVWREYSQIYSRRLIAYDTIQSECVVAVAADSRRSARVPDDPRLIWCSHEWTLLHYCSPTYVSNNTWHVCVYNNL